jgi:serine/threonine protein kinase
LITLHFYAARIKSNQRHDGDAFMTDQPLQFGKYQILATLGQGDFDVVHKARDMALERTVALKVLAPHRLADDGLLLLP